MNEWSFKGTVWPSFVPVEERAVVQGNGLALFRARAEYVLHQEGAGGRQSPRKTLKKGIPADCFHFRRIFVIFV